MVQKPKLIKLSEFIGKTDEEFINNKYGSILIDDYYTLVNNFDLFLQIVKTKTINMFYSKDINCLKYIENNLKDYENITLSLIDDFENKDRSYINTPEFEKTNIEIPLSYIMWNPIIKEKQPISSYYSHQTLFPFNSIYNSFSKANLQKIKEIVLSLSSKYKHLTDLEKTIIISNYIQDNVQYVYTNNISLASSGIYITDSGSIIPTDVSVRSPETVLIEKYGVCNGIANATTMLLNNPEMNVDIRSVANMLHVWNIVQIDGKYYYVDNTWNITRNKDKYEESLKARSFSSDYLFLGSNTANQIGAHIPESKCKVVEETDLDKSIVANTQKKLSKTIRFDNYHKPVFKSHLK